MSGIRRFSGRVVLAAAVAALSVFGAPAVQAQTQPAAPAPGGERRLSITDAVELALKQNADLDVVRIAPLIQDENIGQARGNWAPFLSSFFQGDNRNSPPNSFLSGGQTKVTNTQTLYNFGFGSNLPWYGSSYRVGWDNYRSTTNNAFANFSPQVGSTLNLNFTQPLLRNFGIDQTRQQLQVSRKNREISEVQVKRSGRDDHPVGEERLLGSGLLAEQPRGAAAVARSRPALAEGEPRSRRDRHDGADRHRPGRGGGRSARGGGDRRRSRHRQDRGRSCAPSSTASTPPSSGTRGWCRPTPRRSRPWPSICTRPRGPRSRAAPTSSRRRRRSRPTTSSIRFLRNQIMPDLSAAVDYGATGIGGSQFIRGDGFPGPIIGTLNRPYTDVLARPHRGRLPHLDLHHAA